jgi:hypothetical protein
MLSIGSGDFNDAQLVLRPMSQKCQSTKSLRDSPLKRGLPEGAVTK